MLATVKSAGSTQPAAPGKKSIADPDQYFEAMASPRDSYEDIRDTGEFMEMGCRKAITAKDTDSRPKKKALLSKP